METVLIFLLVVAGFVAMLGVPLLIMAATYNAMAEQYAPLYKMIDEEAKKSAQKRIEARLEAIPEEHYRALIEKNKETRKKYEAEDD